MSMARLMVGDENGTPVELYFEDHGTGEPVVLIHCWPLSSRVWEAQIPALVDAGHRVIAYDRRGFGWSSQPSEGYDYDTLAADLRALLEHLDVRDATLVGYSMGGGEVVRYIATYGTDRVAKAVLLATALPYRMKTDDNPDGDADDALIAQFQEVIRKDRPAFLEGFVERWFGEGAEVGPASAARHGEVVQLGALASAKGTVDCIAAIVRTDFRAELEKVNVPTLVIHGEADAGVPLELTSRRTHEAIAGSELVVIQGAPHGLVLTHAEEVNRALLDFLER
jgi:pimeloyl-ACP methyl ester carboxylesterase